MSAHEHEHKHFASAEEPAMTAAAPGVAQHLRRRKRWDGLFALAGLLIMLAAVMTLILLLAQLAGDGLARLDSEFFTRFPSRFPQRAGIYSAWVGTLLVMLVTAFVAATELSSETG